MDKSEKMFNDTAIKQVLIIGAGGQGQVIADALLFAEDNNKPIKLSGFLDDNKNFWNKTILGRPVLGPLALINEMQDDLFILGIGGNRKRNAKYKNI